MVASSGTKSFEVRRRRRQARACPSYCNTAAGWMLHGSISLSCKRWSDAAAEYRNKSSARYVVKFSKELYSTLKKETSSVVLGTISRVTAEFARMHQRSEVY